MVAGLAAPSRGDLVVGADRSQVGYLAHEPLVYRELTALENLDLFGRLYRVPERRERIGMLLERFGLWNARSERVSAYSRGMTQRLALCRVLLHEPDLLVLDEPTRHSTRTERPCWTASWTLSQEPAPSSSPLTIPTGWSR
jgi:ABC-type multidrug transport system ATPase subunit